MVTVGESLSHGLVLDRDNEALLWVSAEEKGVCFPSALQPLTVPLPRELSVKREQRCSLQLWSTVEKSSFTQERKQIQMSLRNYPRALEQLDTTPGRNRVHVFNN